jgi:hypothetical protein
VPITEAELTAMQERFAKGFASTRDHVYAATKAGYRSPAVRGYDVLKHPAVAARVDELIKEKFVRYAEDVPDVLATIMYDIKAKGADRIKAATLIAKGAGYDAEKDNSDLQPHEMTPEQLAKALNLKRVQLDALEQVAADKARPIEAIVERDEHDLFG